MPTNADLGQAIRRLRWDRDLTIEALAFAADIHPTFLGRIERGGASPTWGKITSVARALDVPVSALVQTAEQEAEVARAVREARARIAGVTPPARRADTAHD
jgi:XRE family transcriptional regulator, regulator of sulfur utilization